jgi:mono/diheme cytochrome c family protein
MLMVAVAVRSAPVSASQAPSGPRVTAAGSGLFNTYCVVCHGNDARGTGPLADTLKRRPADLTALAKNNKGAYPRDLVARIIDGRNPVRGHGGGDMPVWGDAFTRAGGTPEGVQDRITALVDYLETVQAK